MFNYYKLSKDKLIELMTDRTMSEEEWNRYAKENGMFTSNSMKTIMEVNSWGDLIKKLKRK